MPPSISSAPFFQPGASPSWDSLKPPFAAHAGSLLAAERGAAPAERDLLADLEPHWVATIDAATD